MDRHEVLVIGGSTYDITSKALGATVPADSNPSRIYGSPGGVGRNIAVNMAKMNLCAGFLTVLGTDSFSDAIRVSCNAAGLDCGQSVTVPGGTAGIYLSVLDRNGDLIIGASDLALTEQVTPADIAARADYIRSFPLVLADTNLTAEVLEAIAGTVSGRLFADAVSVKKAVRLLPVLNRTDTLKVNRTELAALTGLETGTAAQARIAAERLREKGVRRVFVTLGAEGCFVYGEEGFFSVPGFPVKVVNVTGAGDAFAAAVVYGTARGYSDRDILLLGSAASRIALESPEAVGGALTEDAVLHIYSMLKELM